MDLKSCPYCGTAALRPSLNGIQDRLRHVPGRWGFLRCDGCGSAVLHPFPESDQIASFYPSVYSFAPQTSQGRLKRWWSHWEDRLIYRSLYNADVRNVLRHARPLGGKSVLDIGCGRGLRLRGFLAAGYDVQAADFQPEFVDYIRRELNVNAVCSEIGDLTSHFQAATFDLITAYYVLEHVEDVSGLLRTSWQLLRPGGWLAAAVPLYDSLQRQILGRRWCQLTEAPRHLTIPSREGLRAACREAGFREIVVRPDSLRLSAACIGLSLVPRATTHGAYGGSAAMAVLSRVVGGAVAAAAIPWCALEQFVLRRPALGIVFARKPLDSSIDSRTGPTAR